MTKKRASGTVTGNGVRTAGGTGVPPVQAFQSTRRNLPHMQEPREAYFLTWHGRVGQTPSPEERVMVLQAIRHWDGRKWKLYAAVIMTDHVHVLAQPLPHPDGGVFDLGEMLHSVKSFTAHKIMARRGTEGSLWQDESYDRIIRDEVEFLEKWNYIRNNPVRAGLAQSPEDYPWLYERV